MIMSLLTGVALQYPRNKIEFGQIQIEKKTYCSKCGYLQNLKENSSTWKPNTNIITKWLEDTSSFWILFDINLSFNGRLNGIYDSVLTLEARQGEDVLRSRFLVLFFHDLIVSMRFRTSQFRSIFYIRFARCV